MQKQYPISIIIIAKNEAQNLRELLPQLSWSNDVVVVDDCSDDDTLEICSSFPCKVFQNKMQGFGIQKQFAVSKVSNDWILSLDADERPSKKLIEEIVSIIENPKEDVGGYYIPVRHIFMGKEFRYGKENEMPHLRFFNKNKAGFTSAKVHEKVVSEYPLLTLKGYILHDSYRDISHYFNKFNNYTSIAAQELFNRKKKKSFFSILLSTPFVFFKIYIINLNVFNGKEGLLNT